MEEQRPRRVQSWLSESGKISIDGLDRDYIMIVDQDEKWAAKIAGWVNKKYSAEVVRPSSALQMLREEGAEKYHCVIAEKSSGGIALLDAVLSGGRRGTPILLMAGQQLTDAEQALSKGSADFLIKPFGEAQLMSRVQTALELFKSSVKNEVYMRHMEENMKEMKRLKEEAAKKDEIVKKTMVALESPIAGVTSALVSVLATPELQNSPVRFVLQDILKKMMEDVDVYRPALKNVLSSKLDPVALSLLQSYYNDVPVTEVITEPRKGSDRRGSMIGISSDFDPEMTIHAYKLASWDFDCFKYDNKELRKMLFAIFMFYSSDDLLFDVSNLRKFILTTEKSYLENPYHCFRHAFDVTQTLFAMVETPENQIIFSNIQIVSMLLACFLHDVGHPGYNNKYLITIDHELALRYNDRSVLENYHCARGFEIIKSSNLLIGCSGEVYREIRANIISCIFATDMAGHFTLLGKLEQLEHRLVGGKFDQSNASDKLLMMEALVHSADISNVTRNFDLSRKWANLVTEEFFKQGDIEKEKKLSVEAFMDRDRSNAGLNTANFIQFVARKFFVIMANLHPPLAHYIQNMEENFTKFSGGL